MGISKLACMNSTPDSCFDNLLPCPELLPKFSVMKQPFYFAQDHVGKAFGKGWNGWLICDLSFGACG